LPPPLFYYLPYAGIIRIRFPTSFIPEKRILSMGIISAPKIQDTPLDAANIEKKTLPCNSLVMFFEYIIAAKPQVLGLYTKNLLNNSE